MSLKILFAGAVMLSLCAATQASAWGTADSKPVREIASQSIQCHTLYTMLADSRGDGEESSIKATLMGDLYRVSSAVNGHPVTPWDLTVAQKAWQKTLSGIAELTPGAVLNQLERCEGWSNEIAETTDTPIMPWLITEVPAPRDTYLLDPARIRALSQQLSESLDPEKTIDRSRFLAGASFVPASN